MTVIEENFYRTVPQQLKKMADLLEKTYNEIIRYNSEEN